MTRIGEPRPPDEPVAAYDAFWTAAEAGLDSPTKTDDTSTDPTDTYAAFHAAADE
jgi:hypothetical protein